MHMEYTISCDSRHAFPHAEKSLPSGMLRHTHTQTVARDSSLDWSYHELKKNLPVVCETPVSVLHPLFPLYLYYAYAYLYPFHALTTSNTDLKMR